MERGGGWGRCGVECFLWSPIMYLGRYCLYHTEYCTSSLSKATKKPRMVRNMTALAVRVRPHAPPSI